MVKTWIIENSKAPNAIGDTVASFPAIHAAAWDSPLKVYLSAAKCRDLLYHPKVEILTEKPTEGFVMDVQELFPKYAHSGLSLPRAYLDFAGYSLLAQNPRHPEIILNVIFDTFRFDKGYDLLIAPFSNSDNGTNTKIWSEYNWLLLIQEFKKHNKKIGLLGTSNDNVENYTDKIDLFLDKPLTEVCLLLSEAKLVMTVDNGLNWLAQGSKANHLLLMPQTQHPNWTANPAPNAVNMHLTASLQDVFGGITHLMRAPARP